MNTKIQKELNEHPVSMYINSLTSQHSKNGMALALRRAINFMPQIDGEGEQIFNVFFYRWGEVDRAQVLALKTSLLKKYCPGTTALTLTAVKRVMNECFNNGTWGITGDILKRIENVKNPRVYSDPTVGSYVPLEDIEKLKEVMSHDIKKDCQAGGKRDLAILGWMYTQGVRVGELCGAELRDFNAKTGELIIRHAKGGKYRKNVLHNGAKDAMIDWIKARGKWQGALFVSLDKYGKPIRSGKHLSTSSISKMLIKRQKQAGVNKFSPHSLRRSFVTNCIDQYGVEVAQIIVGHTSINTTMQYYRGDKDKAFELCAGMQF